MADFQAFQDRGAACSAAAAFLADALRAGLSARGQAGAALSGGSTPAPAYAALAGAPLEWPRVRFGLVDERFAPLSDPASNEAMIRRALAPALAAGAKIAPMHCEGQSLEAAAKLADAEYTGLAFDVALLGMGGDAHTASWFPGNPSLAAALDPAGTRTVIGLVEPGAAGRPERLTLTFHALAKIARIGLLITGEDKRARLEAAKGEPEAQAPMGAVLRGLNDRLTVFWAP